MHIVIFLLVIFTVVVSVHLYLWQRLVRHTMRPGPWRKAAGFVVLGLALLVPVTILGRRLPHEYQLLLAWSGYLWLALMFYLLLSLALLEPPRLALRWWVRRGRARSKPAEVPALVHATVGPGERLASPPAAERDALPEKPDGEPAPDAPPTDRSGPSFDPSRRLFIARGAAAVAGVAALTATGTGIRTALGEPDLLRVPVRLAKLPASMDGFRIAVVSDIHVGPLLGRAHTERIVRIINSVDADLVAVVGDVVDGTVGEMGPAVEPLQDLRSRHGTYFVTGNHEYFSGHEPWVEELERLGLDVLRNERVEIDGLDLAGVNDVTGAAYRDGPDLDAALGGRDDRRPAILLAHQPVLVHQAARRGVDLQLSGHTHGGQMVPFNLVVGLQQPVIAGLDTVDGTQVYVTRGAGFWGPPVRVGAPPDVSVIELRPVPR